MNLSLIPLEMYARLVSGNPKYEKTTAAKAKDHFVTEDVKNKDFIVLNTSSITPKKIISY